MVGYDKQSSKLTQRDYMVAGGGSGFITRMLCQPLDVLKIRFQLQVEPIAKGTLAKYQSIMHAVEVIIEEEGIKALWKGHIPAQLLSVSYGVVQFWSFEVLTKEASYLKLSKSWDPVVNFTCGAIGGASATLASFPFDVLRTRLVAQSEQKKIYSGVFEAVTRIIKHEGPLVLYRGLWPTVVQIAPHAGVQFMTYKIFDKIYKNFVDSQNTSFSSSLFAGSLAGLCAKTVVYPFDLAKKRMQVQGFEEGRRHFGEVFKCRGLNDCLLRIYEAEGFQGFFKGLSPSLIKAVFASALHFTSYEMICKLLSNVKQ